jgi:anti-sigma B factor antagonist
VGDDARRPDQPVAEIARRGEAIVVRLAGELDLYNAPVVRETLVGLAAERPGRLVVDLEAVEFLDSTALGVLVETRARLGDRDAFAIASAGVEIARALEISGLARQFHVHGSVEEALAARPGE